MLLWKQEITCLFHSHKKRKDCLETRAVYIEISLLSCNLPDGPKHRGSVLRNTEISEGDQLLSGASYAIMDIIEFDILQIAKKWNWKWIFIQQGYFFRKIPAINASFAPKYLPPQGWSLKFGQNIKMFQPKYWNVMQEDAQVNKAERFMFEQYRQTSKRKINVRNVSKSKALEFQRKRYHFRLWVFAFNSKCLYCWHWRVLQKVLQCKWCKRLSDPLLRLQYHFALRGSKS